MAEPALTLLTSLGLSYLAYTLTARLVPLLGPNLVAKGLGGYDMLKPAYSAKRSDDAALPKQTMLPEATGVIAASVYILLLSLFAPLPYLAHLLPTDSHTAFLALPALNTTTALPLDTTLLDNALQFPHHSFSTYLASLLSLLTATFLGFLDDLFDIRWRWKIPIPLIASVPLLVTYAAGHGITDVVLPRLFALRTLFNVESTSGVLHLGPLYYLYMSLLSTFCTNSINILAGVNGVEVGQALVIALSIALNDLLYIKIDISLFYPSAYYGTEPRIPHLIGIGLARGSIELADRHLFSLYFMLPLIGVCFGLLKHNWYPAKAFIGDTFCYFAGMAFAVVGILGHFSKTLLLFFLPQIFNFLYSTPQLFGLIPCPRHRLPHFNPSTGLLEPSYAPLPLPPAGLAKGLLTTLSAVGLLSLRRDPNGTIIACSNFTILNLILVRRGSMREDRLAREMLALQVLGSGMAFLIRYGGAGTFYDSSRR